jgi:hypothetical protein
MYQQLANATVSAGGMTIQVEGIDYHRNGVGGEGFHIVAFRWADRGHAGQDEPRPMLGIVFGADLAACRVAVLDREQARIGNIFMHPNKSHAGGNAWRGDEFQAVLVKAIRAAAAASPSAPYDPFEGQEL